MLEKLQIQDIADGSRVSTTMQLHLKRRGGDPIHK
jgi:hypothetical protein